MGKSVVKLEGKRIYFGIRPHSTTTRVLAFDLCDDLLLDLKAWSWNRDCAARTCRFGRDVFRLGSDRWIVRGSRSRRDVVGFRDGLGSSEEHRYAIIAFDGPRLLAGKTG